ncbi:MAG TPA: Uma2 family endonuclease [Polyangiales bacterium]|nr:Uma2 family endonuclease [Polyangiales bacterium]
MSTPARAFVTEAEFLALPESNQHIELVDGDVIVAPTPTYWHQEVLTRIVTALRNWACAQNASVTVAQSPLDVRFAPGRILQPDAMVFLEVLPLDIAMPVDRIPAICIEVLSSDRTYDRVTKRYLYAEAGVREYWIVDPTGTFERRSGAALGEHELCERELTSTLLAGFALELLRVFAR